MPNKNRDDFFPWLIPFLPLAYFVYNYDIVISIWEAIKHYESIWWIAPLTATLICICLHHFFIKRYVVFEAAIHWIIWTICMFLCFGLVYATTTSGLESYNFVNSYVTAVYYEEEYEVENCAGDDGCDCYSRNAKWYAKTQSLDEIKIRPSVYEKYEMKFGTGSRVVGKNGDSDCKIGYIWKCRFDHSKPSTMKTATVLKRHINFEHASKRANGYNPKSLLNTTYYEPYPSVKDWGWGALEVNRVLTSGLSIENTKPLTKISHELSEELAYISPKHQVNVFLKLVDFVDFDIAFQQVDSMWLGGQKNDVILVIGTDENLTIHQVKTLCPGCRQHNNLIFAPALEAKISKLGNLKSPQLVKTIINQITQKGEAGFTRAYTSQMKHFVDEIPVKLWQWALIISLCFLLNLYLCWYLIEYDLKSPL